MNTLTKYHSLLPIHVQKELQQAAAIDPKVPASDSRRRTTALEDVLDRARLFNPERFKPEPKE